MSPAPNRETTAGRAFLDLRKLARSEGRPTAELLQLFVLERFLARVTCSPYKDQLVLKGGVLLVAYSARRPTRDVDLAASGIQADPATVERLVCEIASIALDDGLEFDTAAATSESIREGDTYSGIRVSIPCRLATAKMKLSVDLSVGDPIWPEPSIAELPALLDQEPLRIRGYPVSMILAEKVTTAIALGTANTRWRDFVDITSLARSGPHRGETLRRSLETVSAFRHVELAPLAHELQGLGKAGQTKWATWRNKQDLQGATPAALDELLGLVAGFIDPILNSPSPTCTWDPTAWTWTED